MKYQAFQPAGLSSSDLFGRLESRGVIPFIIVVVATVDLVNHY